MAIETTGKDYTMNTDEAYAFCSNFVKEATGVPFHSVHHFKGLVRNEGVPARRTGDTPKGFRYRFNRQELQRWLTEIYIPVFVGMRIGPDV